MRWIADVCWSGDRSPGHSSPSGPLSCLRMHAGHIRRWISFMGCPANRNRRRDTPLRPSSKKKILKRRSQRWSQFQETNVRCEPSRKSPQRMKVHTVHMLDSFQERMKVRHEREETRQWVPPIWPSFILSQVAFF